MKCELIQLSRVQREGVVENEAIELVRVCVAACWIRWLCCIELVIGGRIVLLRIPVEHRMTRVDRLIELDGIHRVIIWKGNHR